MSSAIFELPEDFKWLPPWVRLPTDYHAAFLSSFEQMESIVLVSPQGVVEELRREMPENHVLFGRELTALAVDVEWGHKSYLFATNDPQSPLAWVHLTFQAESKSNFPRTKLFSDLDAWVAEMERDHKNVGSPALTCRKVPALPRFARHYKLMTRCVGTQIHTYCCRCGEVLFVDDA